MSKVPTHANVDDVRLSTNTTVKNIVNLKARKIKLRFPTLLL